MLNEKAFFDEIQNYKDAKYKGNIFYIANLFTKFYINSGKAVLDIRVKIEEWARANDTMVIKDINYDIGRTFAKLEGFKEWQNIPITRRDINFISREVTTRGRRRVLFALLLMGKRYGDNRGEFAIPIEPFSEWLGYANSSNLYTRHIPWLVEKMFIENMTENYRIRGMYLNEGFYVFKLNYLLFPDNQETVFEVEDNNFNHWFEIFENSWKNFEK